MAARKVGGFSGIILFVLSGILLLNQFSKGNQQRAMAQALESTNDEQAFLADLAAARKDEPIHQECTITQNETARTGGLAECGVWNILMESGDFDAMLSSGGRSHWLTKRAQDYWFSNLNNYYHFGQDTLEKGHLNLQPWGHLGRMPHEWRNHYSTRKDALDGNAFTAALFHMLINISPADYFSHADSLALESVEIMVNGEVCRRISMIPAWVSDGIAENPPLGLRPVVHCDFAVSDYRLLYMQIELSRVSEIDPTQAESWITISSSVSTFSDDESVRKPLTIVMEMTDHSSGRVLSLTNHIAYQSEGKYLSTVSPSVQRMALELEPKDQAIYAARIATDADDQPARKEIVRQLALSDDTASAVAEIDQVAARTTSETRPLSLVQLAEMSFAAGDRNKSLALAEQALDAWYQRVNEGVALDDGVRRRAEAIRAWSLCRLERQDEAMPICRQLLESIHREAVYQPTVMDEFDTYRLDKLMEEIDRSHRVKHNYAEYMLQQANAMVERLAGIAGVRSYQDAYDRWCRYRREYLKAKTWHDEFSGLEDFIAGGHACGLDSFELALERFIYLRNRAVHKRYRDTLADRENRHFIQVYLNYLEKNESDREKYESEKKRIARLFLDSDPVVREAEAGLIKRIFSQYHDQRDWQEYNDLFDQAQAELQKMLPLADRSIRKRLVLDAQVSLLDGAEQLYAWPPVPMNPRIEAVLDLRDELPDADSRTMFDANRARVLVKHGRADEGMQLRDSLQVWSQSNAIQLPIEQRDEFYYQVAEIQNDYDKMMASPKVDLPWFAAYESELSRPIAPSEVYNPPQFRYLCSMAAVEYHTEIAKQTSIPGLARSSIENAVNAARRAGGLARSMERATFFADHFAQDSPAFKQAAAQLMLIQSLGWNRQYREAMAKIEDLVLRYGQHENREVQICCADALFLGYVYNYQYLDNAADSDVYIDRLRSLYGNRFDFLIDRYHFYLSQRETMSP